MESGIIHWLGTSVSRYEGSLYGHRISRNSTLGSILEPHPAVWKHGSPHLVSETFFFDCVLRPVADLAVTV